MTRRKMIAIVGDAGVKPGSPAYEAARHTGRLAIDHGFRIVTGGLTGVMQAACRGAHESASYHEGDTIGLLPQDDPREANEWVDIALATGMNHARNVLVANADAVIAAGGGAGTLSEVCFAWTFRRLVIALDLPGRPAEMAGKPLDGRVRYPDMPEDRIFLAADATEAFAIIRERLPLYTQWGRAFAPRRTGPTDDEMLSGT